MIIFYVMRLQWQQAAEQEKASAAPEVELDQKLSSNGRR